jgi:ABC-type Fe3+ transport system substrate-binding protein
MQLTTNNPSTVDGKTYDIFGLALVISSFSKPNSLSSSVVMKLTPMRKSEDGTFEQLTNPEYQKTLVVGDSSDHNDSDFLKALQEIHNAVQKYIDAKNI